MNLTLIITILVLFIGAITLIIYHNSGRNIYDTFVIYDSVTLQNKIQVHICTFHDKELFDPDFANRRARRAGYRIATQFEARAANTLMEKPTPNDDLYFLISSDDKGIPRLTTFIKRTGFTTEEQMRAPKFVALVKMSSAISM